jgi:hypothetical protein
MRSVDAAAGGLLDKYLDGNATYAEVQEVELDLRDLKRRLTVRIREIPLRIRERRVEANANGTAGARTEYERFRLEALRVQGSIQERLDGVKARLREQTKNEAKDTSAQFRTIRAEIAEIRQLAQQILKAVSK